MNASTLVAVGLSLVSAVAYALAAVAQERLAAGAGTKTGLIGLLRRGAWWWSVGLNAGGALLHAAALTFGSLTVVQPLGALTLVAAVPLGARRAGRQVSRGEWRGTAFTLVGLAVILLAAAGTAPDDTLTLPQVLGVSGVALALVAALTRPGARPGLRHAAASGVTSGVASAFTQTVTVAAAARRADGGLPVWQVACVALLVAAFASGGLLLSQTAYRGGLGAPLAVLTLANPVAAAAIGLTLLQERLQGGVLGIAAACAGAVIAARGVVLLTRTAAVVGVPPDLEVPVPVQGTGPSPVGAARPAEEGVPSDVRTLDVGTPDRRAAEPDRRAAEPDRRAAEPDRPTQPVPAVQAVRISPAAAVSRRMASGGRPVTVDTLPHPVFFLPDAVQVRPPGTEPAAPGVSTDTDVTERPVAPWRRRCRCA